MYIQGSERLNLISVLVSAKFRYRWLHRIHTNIAFVILLSKERNYL